LEERNREGILEGASCNIKEDRRNNARGIDDSDDDDVVMEEDNYVIEARFEEYFYNVITNN
jgi:hypothetical protein